MEIMDVDAKAEETRDYVDVVVLVSVSDDRLELNRDALSLLTGSEDNIPVILMSVVGQPKSRKTSLLNEVLTVFGESFRAPENLFPLNSDDGSYKNLKGREGILLWKYPHLLPLDDGCGSLTRFQYLFMDIWMETPRVEVYHKLVDVCLSISSAVIFAEPCDPNPEVYWQPTSSSLKLLDFSNSLQMYFFIQTDSDVVYTVGNGFSKTESHFSSKFKNKLDTVYSAVSFLAARCGYVNMALIPLTDKEAGGSLVSKNLFKYTAIKNFLSILNPLLIGNERVDTSGLQYWLEKIITKFNAASVYDFAETEDDDVELIEVPRKRMCPSLTARQVSLAASSLKINPEIKPHGGMEMFLAEITELYNKEFKRVADHFRRTKFYLTTAQLNHYHKTICQRILGQKNFPALSLVLNSKIQQLFSDLFEEMKRKNSEEQTSVAAFAHKIETETQNFRVQIEAQNFTYEQFSESPSFTHLKDSVQEQFKTLYEGLCKGVPDHWMKIVYDNLNPTKDSIFRALQSIFSLNRAYIDNFSHQLRDYICLETEKCEYVHQQCLASAKIKSNYRLSRREKWNEICMSVITMTKENFVSQNTRAYTAEEDVAKQAHDHAVGKYVEFMEMKIFSRTLTESKLGQIHKLASESISGLFLAALPHQRTTEPWMKQGAVLKQTLESLLENCKRKNHCHLKKLELVKKEGFNAGKSLYEEAMVKLPKTGLTFAAVNDHHNKSVQDALLKLKAKTGDIDSRITKVWEEELKKALGSYRYHYGKDCPAPIGVGVYIDSDEVCVGVYRSQNESFAEDIVCYHPLIAFSRNEVLIGQAASSCRNKHAVFKIYDLLHHCTDSEAAWKGNIDDQLVSLQRDEILALYFQRIRLDTEKSLNQKVESCYVAVTGLLSSGSKQILKTALANGGFLENTLIPCSTAMAVSFYMSKPRKEDFGYRRDNCIIVVYASSKLVEVASASLTPREVHVSAMSGDTDIERERASKSVLRFLTRRPRPTISQRIWHAVTFATSSHHSSYQYERVVVCGRSLTISNRFERDLMQQLRNIPSVIPEVATFSATQNILKVAALLDAHRKGHPELLESSFKIPAYNSVAPYKTQVCIGRRFPVVVNFNGSVPVDLSIPPDFRGWQNMTVKEQAKDSNSEWAVAEYRFRIWISSLADRILVRFGQEGNVSVRVKSQMSKEPIETSTRSLALGGHRRIAHTISTLLSAQETRHGLQMPCIKIEPEPPETVTMSKASVEAETGPELPTEEDKARDVTEELVEGVKTLIEQVRLQLESTQAPTSMRDHVRSKIRKCEDLISAPELKVKQLQMEKTNLERAFSLVQS